MKLSFCLNGEEISLEVPADRKVIDLLRCDLGLTGTKEGCGSGECGACTIVVDGRTRLACLMLAGQLEGCRVETIEGLDRDGRLDSVQEAFVEKGAVQCGFCTPGMVMVARALLESDPRPSRQKIRAGLGGNLCRCTGYQKIVDAVEAAVHYGNLGEIESLQHVQRIEFETLVQSFLR